jgi:hypothetical protein
MNGFCLVRLQGCVMDFTNQKKWSSRVWIFSLLNKVELFVIIVMLAVIFDRLN